MGDPGRHQVEDAVFGLEYFGVVRGEGGDCGVVDMRDEARLGVEERVVGLVEFAEVLRLKGRAAGRLVGFGHRAQRLGGLGRI